MGIQEGAAQVPSAPLQAGHARSWQRPSHISHRDSLGLGSPDSAPAGSGLGPRSWRRWGGPDSPFSRPRHRAGRGPAWPRSGAKGSRGAGPAEVTKLPRAAGRSRSWSRAGRPHLG